jgi:hypothetical protein
MVAVNPELCQPQTRKMCFFSSGPCLGFVCNGYNKNIFLLLTITHLKKYCLFHGSFHTQPNAPGILHLRKKPSKVFLSLLLCVFLPASTPLGSVVRIPPRLKLPTDQES